MIFTSPIISAGSGSVAGLTFSHNAGGMYVRARAIPTDPNSPEQQAVKALVGNLAGLWNSLLTSVQRDAWNVYAANVPLLNPLGQQRNVSGIAMYIRSNTARLQGTLARVDDAPTVFTLGDFTNPSFGFDATADEVDVTFTAADAWANEDAAAMLVYASRPQNDSINFFKGPYRFAGEILGDAITPPTSPAAIAAPFPASAGQRVFERIVVVRADGRVSLDFRGQSDAA